MKNLFELIFLAIFCYLAYLYGAINVPNPNELEFISGSVTEIREVKVRTRTSESYIRIRVARDGVDRDVISYDKAMLSKLKPGQRITAGVYGVRSESELWTLKEDERELMTLRDTLERRRAVRGFGYYWVILFGVAMFIYTVFAREKSLA